jgi:tRNA threonylcarbamoyladenosine biosynthesis protein TsaB
MPLFLLLDTVLEIGIVAIADENGIIDVMYNYEQQQHAAWLHLAIKNIFEKNNLNLKSIDAVSVTNGPGSYTGMRIGLSAAKGLCFALQKPLITISNLQLIALSNTNNSADLYVPMIDARRNEVFTCIYDKYFTIIKDNHALLLNNQCFNIELSSKKVIFCGNGAHKFELSVENENAHFSYANYDVSQFYTLTINAFTIKKFSDMRFVEPNYSKNFYTQKN